MFGSWRKSTPVCEKRKCSSSVSSNDKQLKRVVHSISNDPENSSGLHPILAHLHNEAKRVSVSPTILSVPTNVLAKICRYVVVRDEEIVVCADDALLSSQPALLRVCRGIRNVARPIFYIENDFQFIVQDFDVTALLPWRNMCAEITQALPIRDNESRVTTGFITDKFASASVPASSPYQDECIEFQLDWAVQTNEDERFAGVQFWNVNYESPNWENLVDWLEMWHADEIGSYQPEINGGSKQAALASVFDLVESYCGQSWEFVRTTLPSIRRLLSASDERWSNCRVSSATVRGEQSAIIGSVRWRLGSTGRRRQYFPKR